MKTLTLPVTARTTKADAEQLLSRIPQQGLPLTSIDHAKLDEMARCIETYATYAQKHQKLGTTIQLEQTFEIAGRAVVIALNEGANDSFLVKALRLLGIR